MAEDYIIAKSVSPSSKKIRKSALKLDRDPESKKYETFDPTQRQLILLDLKKILLQKGESVSNLSSDQFIKLLEGLDLEFYRKILAKVLISHVKTLLFFIKLSRCLQLIHPTVNWPSGEENSRAGSKALKNLKTVTSDIIYSHLIQGGSHLVSHDQSEEFKQEIIIILQGLLFRSFPLLQSSAKEVLEKYQNNSSLVNEKESAVCSKHWWFDFLRKYPDVKEMWESLPLEKTYKAGGGKVSSGKKKPGYSRNTSTADGSPSTGFSHLEEFQLQTFQSQPPNELTDESIFSYFAPESPSCFLKSFDEEETPNLYHEFQMPLSQIDEMKETHFYFK